MLLLLFIGVYSFIKVHLDYEIKKLIYNYQTNNIELYADKTYIININLPNDEIKNILKKSKHYINDVIDYKLLIFDEILNYFNGEIYFNGIEYTNVIYKNIGITELFDITKPIQEIVDNIKKAIIDFDNFYELIHD